MTSPTARTLQLLRRLGYHAEPVERWLPGARVRKDLLGCIDVLGLRPGSPVFGVQCTSDDHTAARLKKAVALPQLRTWLACGCAFEVWGWHRRGGRWQVRRVAVRGADLQPVDLTPRPRRQKRQRSLFDGLVPRETDP